MYTSLRARTIRLAAFNPKLRPLLLPIIKAAGSYQDYVKRKRQEGGEPLSEKDWKARTQGAGKKNVDSFAEKNPAADKAKIQKGHIRIKRLIDDLMEPDITEDVADVMRKLRSGQAPVTKSRDAMIDTLHSLRADLDETYDGDADDPEYKRKSKAIQEAVKVLSSLPTVKKDIGI